MEYAILAALLLLVVLAALNLRSKTAPPLNQDPPDWAVQQLKEYKSQIDELKNDLQDAKEQWAFWQQKAEDYASDLADQKDVLHNKELEWTKRVSELESEVESVTQKKDFLTEQYQQFVAQEAERKQAMEREFKLLANQILEEKSNAFKTTNSEALAGVLGPFKEQLIAFKDEVEKAKNQENQNTGALLKELSNLQKLNGELGAEAQALTKALKGENKTQGNWGELVLERALELSGLTKNKEYFVQNSTTTAEGRRLQPDVVIQLPGDKRLVIDSKVSLVGWEGHVNASDPIQAEAHMKAHLASLKQHIKGLSEKDYTQLYEVTPEFVLLFVPIEAAFIEATKSDPTLYEYGFERRIVVVTTSTLLATLKTIAMSWRQEKQTKNVLAIAELGGKMHDKFASLVEDIVKIKSQLGTVMNTQESAMTKLTGRGGLVGQADKLRKLGAKTKKSLDAAVMEQARLESTTNPAEDAEEIDLNNPSS